MMGRPALRACRLASAPLRLESSKCVEGLPPRVVAEREAEAGHVGLIHHELNVCCLARSAQGESIGRASGTLGTLRRRSDRVAKLLRRVSNAGDHGIIHGSSMPCDHLGETIEWMANRADAHWSHLPSAILLMSAELSPAPRPQSRGNQPARGVNPDGRDRRRRRHRASGTSICTRVSNRWRVAPGGTCTGIEVSWQSWTASSRARRPDESAKVSSWNAMRIESGRSVERHVVRQAKKRAIGRAFHSCAVGARDQRPDRSRHPPHADRTRESRLPGRDPRCRGGAPASGSAVASARSWSPRRGVLPLARGHASPSGAARARRRRSPRDHSTSPARVR